MTMERTLLTCVVLAMMAAIPAAADDDILSCCMPDKWEGRQLTTVLTSSTFGGTYVTQMVADVTYDAINKREVFIVNQTDTNGNFAYYKFLAFYGDSLGYKYDLQKDKCQALQIGSFPMRCVPASSKILDADVTLGAGDNELTASRVYYETPSGKTTAYGTMLVTEECIPISETSMQSYLGVFKMKSHAFENLEEGIESDAIFDLPESCKALAKSKRSRGNIWKREMKSEDDFVTLARLPPA